MNDDLALALVTIGGAGLLLEPRGERDHAPSSESPRRPGPDSTTTPIPRTFDPIFARHGQGIPVAFLRALAWNESRHDPRVTSRRSSATGLLQIIDVVRADHNRLHGTAYTRADLHDPVINVTIAASALRRIVQSYARNHPEVRNLLEDWNNFRFAELLTQGWNAGWSERAGLGRVARYLEQLRTTNITAALIQQHARAAGATPHLADPARLAWAQKVARAYAAGRAGDAAAVAQLAGPVPDRAKPISSPDQVDHVDQVARPVG